MSVDYRDVPNIAGYRVGSDGTVWSRWNNRWGLRNEWRQLKPGLVKSTSPHYARPMVVIGGKCRYVAHLILEAFVGQRPEGAQACHNDDDPSNNAASNLRWDSRAANMRDRADHGLTKGERHHAATLTNDKVRMIRKLADAGETHTAIGAALGVQRRTVTKVVSRERWSHVP